MMLHDTFVQLHQHCAYHVLLASHLFRVVGLFDYLVVHKPWNKLIGLMNSIPHSHILRYFEVEPMLEVNPVSNSIDWGSLL